jgi:hypothetical protein
VGRAKNYCTPQDSKHDYSVILPAAKLLYRMGWHSCERRYIKNIEGNKEEGTKKKERKK